MKRLLLILLCLPMIGFGQVELQEQVEYNKRLAKQYSNTVYRELIRDGGVVIPSLFPFTKLRDYRKVIAGIDSSSEWKDKYKKSITVYTEVIRINPDNAKAYHIRGYSYAKLRDYRKAIADYTEVIRINPDDDKAYDMRGYSYANVGDEYWNFKKAIADYTEVIRINPDDAKAYCNRGIAKENFMTGEYCYDYKRACFLGNKKGCKRYDKRCKPKPIEYKPID